MNRKYNFIDLFAGCGGLSKGLELAGHRCLLGVDSDKDSINTFKENHIDSEVYLGDIRDLSEELLNDLIKNENIDFIVGGPPCQGFSTVGKGSVDDSRNKLFLEFVRVVKTLMPKVIVIENVTGLLAKKNHKILQQIFESFQSLGYDVDARVLSSEEYGVPEKRRRAVIIGARDGLMPLFPEITHGERGKYPVLGVKNAIFDLKAANDVIYNHDIESATIKNDLDRERIKHIPSGCGIRYQRDEERFLPKYLFYNIKWSEMSEGRFRQTKLQRLPLESPSFTILTSQSSYFHPTEDRYLTVREVASIQTFPNDFIFHGSKTSQFKQVGNAVPVLLAKSIGECIYQIMDRKVNRRYVHRESGDHFSKKAFYYSSYVAL